MTCYDFEGRVALITGAAGGIGRAIADRLAACGARLVLWDMRPLEGLPPDAIRRGRRRHRPLLLSRQGRDRALAAAGRIDVLVNNAGIAGPTVPVEAYSPADWRRVMAINLDGVFHCCRAVAPVMRQPGVGAHRQHRLACGQGGHAQRRRL